jgi:hypothetical protein
VAAAELTVATQASVAVAYRDSGNDRGLVALSLAMRVNQSTVLGGPGLAHIRDQKESRFVVAPGPTSAIIFDVREPAIHDDGTAVRQFPPLRSTHTGVPFLDSQKKVRIPRIPARTARDCNFEIWIRTRLGTAPVRTQGCGTRTQPPHFGIGSWILHSRFEVGGGKLEESGSTVGEERRSGSYKGLARFGYEVVSTAHSDRSYEYNVRFARITGPFESPCSAACTSFTRGTNWAPPRPSRVRHTNQLALLITW